MARDDKYALITVNDDDEVVIQAGMPPQPPVPGPAGRTAGATDEAADDTDGKADGKAAGEAPAPAGPAESPGQAPEAGAHKGAAPGPGSAEEPPAADAYRETTLDDLEELGPVPKVRVAVIVCAVLFIAGFLLYYGLMR
ncbi:MAG: hypothetical protein FWG23_03410 [Eggerthellaceae bacterium]|jgi:hypothetical protein|nr:hypothetical protein [Eggerthellaceae bacterium]